MADLPVARAALAVVAHPDDESFGLGALLAAFVAAGTHVSVLCFTHGEASTLGASSDLADVRADELASAAAELGIARVTLHSYADGALDTVAPAELDAIVEQQLDGVDLVIAFEPCGVTGHGDHRAATRAAQRVAGRRGLAVLHWGVPGHVAARLNEELGTTFHALEGHDVHVDRDVQWRAILQHRSQSHDNPVLRRRLELQGELERVRVTSSAGAPA